MVKEEVSKYLKDGKSPLYDPWEGFKHYNHYIAIKNIVQSHLDNKEYMIAAKELEKLSPFISRREKRDISEMIFKAIGDDKNSKYTYYIGIGNPKSGGKKK